MKIPGAEMEIFFFNMKVNFSWNIQVGCDVNVLLRNIVAIPLMAKKTKTILIYIDWNYSRKIFAPPPQIIYNKIDLNKKASNAY